MYNITYQPFVNKLISDTGTQNINITLTNENLAGLILMSSQIINTQNIIINGHQTIDVNRYLGEGQLPYSAKFKNVKVQFNSLEFIQGAILICNLLGKSWQNLIYAPHLRLISNSYLGRILILGSGELLSNSPLSLCDNGQNIDIRQLPQYGVNLITTNALIRDMLDCFGILVGFYLPSNIYTVSTDLNNQDVVASASVTTQNPNFLNSYLIYNACTYSQYKRQGLMKSILIMMINELLMVNLNSDIYLEVDPQNAGAVGLYTSLGFRKVRETTYENKVFNVMKFM